ncbi:MAG: hypothetical protein NTW59_00695 [Candidatus Diapherotrites archaeon]|nr:hypothetical protein [Candidatus Diapherotrites archaeon]
MAIADQWLLFLENHPQFFELSKSGFFISLLNFLVRGAKTFDAISLSFPRVEKKDLQLILATLEEIGAVERVMLAGKLFYLATPSCKELLRLYTETKRFFEV